MNTIQEVVDFMADRAYLWNMNGEYRVPTYADVEQTLDKAVKALYGSTTGSKLEAGRLIIVKDDNKYFVYGLIGEFK